MLSSWVYPLFQHIPALEIATLLIQEVPFSQTCLAFGCYLTLSLTGACLYFLLKSREGSDSIGAAHSLCNLEAFRI